MWDSLSQLHALSTREGQNAGYSSSVGLSAYGSFSIGRLLMVELMKHWWGQVDVFDFARGDEAYKLSFATDVRELLSVSLFRRSLRGRLARLWFD